MCAPWTDNATGGSMPSMRGSCPRPSSKQDGGDTASPRKADRGFWSTRAASACSVQLFVVETMIRRGKCFLPEAVIVLGVELALDGVGLPGALRPGDE